MQQLDQKIKNTIEISSAKLDVLCFKIKNSNYKSIILELNKYFTKFKDMESTPFAIDFQYLTNAPEAEIEKIVDFCINNNLNLIGIKHSDQNFKSIANKYNISFISNQTSLQHNYSPPIILDKPIRSGQQVYAQNCDLIVLNKVNEGAELISDGNIHVYNIMQGRAIAGANNNNKNAKIFIKNMQAQLVSISGIYRTFDKILPQSFNKKQVIISLHNDKLMITAL